MLEAEDTGLVAADSLDSAEEEEGSAASAAWPTSVLFSANDDSRTGNTHNKSKPRWK